MVAYTIHTSILALPVFSTPAGKCQQCCSNIDICNSKGVHKQEPAPSRGKRDVSRRGQWRGKQRNHHSVGTILPSLMATQVVCYLLTMWRSWSPNAFPLCFVSFFVSSTSYCWSTRQMVSTWGQRLSLHLVASSRSLSGQEPRSIIWN